MRSPSRVRRLTGLMVAALALTACVPSAQRNEPGVASPSTSELPSVSSSPSGSAAGEGSGSGQLRCPKKERDLSSATWTWPVGFTEATGYQQAVSLGEQVFERYAIPGTRGQDVLAVVLYGDVPRSDGPMPPDLLGCLQEAAAIVADLTAQLDATVLDGPYEVAVDGVPALREELSQPGGYTYHVTWIPSGAQLLQVSCQYEEYEELITQACDDLLASFDLGTA